MLKHLYGFKYQNLSSGFAMRHPLQVLQVADKYDVPNLAAEVHPLCDVGTIGRSVDIIHCIGIIDLIHEALPLRGGLVHAANQLAARNFIRLSRRLDFKVVAAKHPSLAWYLIENAARKMCGSDGMTMDAAVCLLCADCGVELILRDSDLVAVCPACQQYISDENWHEATTCLVEPDP